MKKKHLLAASVLMGALIFTILDIFVFWTVGTEYTVSNGIHEYLGVGDTHTNRVLLCGFTSGFLMCHLLGWTNRDKSNEN